MPNTTRTLSVNIGFLKGITRQLKLLGRLMVDKRVNPMLKLLPVGAIIYLIVPTDLIPILPFDDAAVLWLGGSLFIEMCPRNVVDEHLRLIDGEPEVTTQYHPNDEDAAGAIVDAEFHEPEKPADR
jgi:uncharacterized membrane protein YkvA (DUF1232 family)